ncbi:MAG TPA: tRNA (adenosine(37)-N6)-dimethylallyltransferase MiaA [Candidatus Eremiobacteraceae bacterium]|nr:tRNA (adenosine(37)-N6)-dimethylallyltransferase MiaA [Candidatus Eremiobacteraceae bacterium]
MNASSQPRALAICGPTAAGKSAIALEVARALDGEIVNADSRQIYRGLTVGTGVPSREALASVPHHLFQFVDPCERYSAGAFVRDANAVMGAIDERGRLPIVVGGTGLYIEALGGSMPMDRRAADEVVRTRVRVEASVHEHATLYEWLGVIGPDDAKRVPSNDRYRTLRAIESVLASRAGEPSHPNSAPLATRRLDIVVLDLDSAVLAERIAARARGMFEKGIVDEALAVSGRCPQAPALTGLGYAEALAWSRGEMTRAEAIASTINRTLRYAKRQRTWFRRMDAAPRVDASDERAAADAIVSIARETTSRT